METFFVSEQYNPSSRWHLLLTKALPNRNDVLSMFRGELVPHGFTWRLWGPKSRFVKNTVTPKIIVICNTVSIVAACWGLVLLRATCFETNLVIQALTILPGAGYSVDGWQWLQAWRHKEKELWLTWSQLTWPCCRMVCFRTVRLQRCSNGHCIWLWCSYSLKNESDKVQGASSWTNRWYQRLTSLIRRIVRRCWMRVFLLTGFYGRLCHGGRTHCMSISRRWWMMIIWWKLFKEECEVNCHEI